MINASFVIASLFVGMGGIALSGASGLNMGGSGNSRPWAISTVINALVGILGNVTFAYLISTYGVRAASTSEALAGTFLGIGAIYVMVCALPGEIVWRGRTLATSAALIAVGLALAWA